ncbi:hypothetical protein [Streptomyces sp. B5E4]|uniref:hypothetical protein n=1 Tax=Streptomyces sp. B5E4 TaxID=3153568 RepID=UPI00325DF090
MLSMRVRGFGSRRPELDDEMPVVRWSGQGLPDETSPGALRGRAVGGVEALYWVFPAFAAPSLMKADGCTAHLAGLDGEPVGTGMTAVTGHVTALFNLATLPRHCRPGASARQ